MKLDVGVDLTLCPAAGYSDRFIDDDELFQDDKEEDLVDLSYFRSDAKYGVGRKLDEGGPPKPDVTNMSTLEATIVLN